MGENEVRRGRQGLLVLPWNASYWGEQCGGSVVVNALTEPSLMTQL